MATMRWQLREAHREVAEDAIKAALRKIEASKNSGGAASHCGEWYVRALSSIRLAEQHLRRSEESRPPQPPTPAAGEW